MLNEPVTFVILVLAAVLSYIVYSLLKTHSLKEILNMLSGRTGPRAEIAGIEMRPDEEACLGYAVSREQAVRLFLKYDVEYQWKSEVCSDDEVAYGLVIIGKVNDPGTGVRDIVTGFGALIPRDVASFTGISYASRFSRVGDECRYRVTIPLCIIEHCSPGSEASVTATIRQSPNIFKSEYRLFFTR